MSLFDSIDFSAILPSGSVVINPNLEFQRALAEQRAMDQAMKQAEAAGSWVPAIALPDAPIPVQQVIEKRMFTPATMAVAAGVAALLLVLLLRR